MVGGMSEETRVTNATGGMKGSKATQLFWIDAGALTALGDVAGYGATKYGEGHNYRLGVNVSLHMNAAWRHILQFQRGEDTDAESGLPHLAHAAWNLLAAHTQTQDHPELDDRWAEAVDGESAVSVDWQVLDTFERTRDAMPWASGMLDTSEKALDELRESAKARISDAFTPADLLGRYSSWPIASPVQEDSLQFPLTDADSVRGALVFTSGGRWRSENVNGHWVWVKAPEGAHQ